MRSRANARGTPPSSRRLLFVAPFAFVVVPFFPVDLSGRSPFWREKDAPPKQHNQRYQDEPKNRTCATHAILGVDLVKLVHAQNFQPRSLSQAQCISTYVNMVGLLHLGGGPQPVRHPSRKMEEVLPKVRWISITAWCRAMTSACTGSRGSASMGDGRHVLFCGTRACSLLYAGGHNSLFKLRGVRMYVSRGRSLYVDCIRVCRRKRGGKRAHTHLSRSTSLLLCNCYSSMRGWLDDDDDMMMI